MDARKCISYLTIEHKTQIDLKYRDAIGNRIFGCDDCLSICPWNKFAKKYSDSGGLLSEEDSSQLMRLYRELSEIQASIGKLAVKTKKTANEKKKEEELAESFAETRRAIVDLETTYQNLFNHTADTKAQNKTILWYMLNISFVNLIKVASKFCKIRKIRIELNLNDYNYYNHHYLFHIVINFIIFLLWLFACFFL